jgi:4-aminobutyrate aminotransferase-like enzyme
MRFEQSREIRRHDGNGIAALYSPPTQRIGELAAAFVEPAVGDAGSTVDDREFVGVNLGWA